MSIVGVGAVAVVDYGRLNKQITGKVEIDVAGDGSTLNPVQRKVRCYDLGTGKLVQEIWSHPDTGDYAFRHLPASTYFTIAHDHTGIYNAVIKDRLTPEDMP